MKLIVLVLGFINLIVFVKTQEIGESCIMSNTRRPGICEELTKCKAVKDTYSHTAPTKCHIGQQRIVCCPIPHQSLIDSDPENRISSQKCEEYGKFYTKTFEFINIENESIIKKYSTCNKVIPLINNGSAASEKEFPHMALIDSCSGSLISDQWVLTAAHCEQPTYVKLGSVNRIENNDDHLIYSVIEVISHPEYVKGLKYNDIALLKLDRVVVFNDNIVPICLPQTRNVNLKVIASGWGEISNQTIPEKLMKVVLEIFSRDECNEHYSNLNISLPDGIVDDMIICAGHRFHPKDTCNGDSGAPLQVTRANMPCMFELVGSTSYGPGNCGTIGVPAIYTRTYNYLDWIEKTVWPESFNKTSEK